MATNTIHHKPYHHFTTPTTYNRFTRNPTDFSYIPSTTLKQRFTSITTFSSSVSVSASVSTSIAQTDIPTSTNVFSVETLERYLVEQNFRQADEETRRLLIVLAGDSAIKRGYVFFSEVQFISKEDLKAIDQLWVKYSNGRFGYSVQKKMWVKVNKDFTRFFMSVGWMKKIDSEIEQFNYRSFPTEFMWELNPVNNNNNNNNNDNDKDGVTLVSDECPPEGHLPLTNALRGTQLLNMILSHPAFHEDDDEDEDEKENGNVIVEEVDNDNKKKSKFASLRDKFFKPNYSF